MRSSVHRTDHPALACISPGVSPTRRACTPQHRHINANGRRLVKAAAWPAPPFCALAPPCSKQRGRPPHLATRPPLLPPALPAEPRREAFPGAALPRLRLPPRAALDVARALSSHPPPHLAPGAHDQPNLRCRLTGPGQRPIHSSVVLMPPLTGAGNARRRGASALRAATILPARPEATTYFAPAMLPGKGVPRGTHVSLVSWPRRKGCARPPRPFAAMRGRLSTAMRGLLECVRRHHCKARQSHWSWRG